MSRPAIIGERIVGDVVVRISGIMHLRFPRDSFRGLQAWRDSDHSFAIEIILEGAAPLLTQYDARWKWLGVLEGLEAAL